MSVDKKINYEKPVVQLGTFRLDIQTGGRR